MDGFLVGFFDIGVRMEEVDVKVIVNLDYLVLVFVVFRDVFCGGREVKFMNVEFY